MSLNPEWMPDDDEDRKRRAAIEEMMRSQRERYFRDEAVQQEYRDIVDRQIAAQEAAVVAARGPGPFDEALARFDERRAAAAAAADNPDEHVISAEARPASKYPQITSVGLPSGVTYPDDSAGDKPDRWTSAGILDAAGRIESPSQRAGASQVATLGAPQAESGDQPPASPQPYRVAHAGTFGKGLLGKAATPPASTPGDINQPVHKISDPLTMALEWHYGFKKYAGEVEQFTQSKGIAGTIIFNGKPKNTDQPANNAFAHAGFSALYAYDNGIDAAKTVGDGREKQNHLKNKVYQALRKTFLKEDLLEDEKERSLKLDIYKDLFNNSIGRQIGLAAKAAGLSRSEVLSEVHEALKSGRLITDEYVDPRVDRNFDGNPGNYRPPGGATR